MVDAPAILGLLQRSQNTPTSAHTLAGLSSMVAAASSSNISQGISEASQRFTADTTLTIYKNALQLAKPITPSHSLDKAVAKRLRDAEERGISFKLALHDMHEVRVS